MGKNLRGMSGLLWEQEIELGMPWENPEASVISLYISRKPVQCTGKAIKNEI